MGLLCQRAENEFVGVFCGIMDQFASLLSRKDFALFLDCRDLSYSYVPLPSVGYKIVITNTKKSRKLPASAYNRRREECEKATELLSINLRDMSSQQFPRLKK